MFKVTVLINLKSVFFYITKIKDETKILGSKLSSIIAHVRDIIIKYKGSAIFIQNKL